MSARLVIALYNLVLGSVLVLVAPLWGILVFRSRRLRAGFGERLRPLAASDAPTLWVHAASAGEVETAIPLVRALRARGVRLCLTALSDTGRARLQEAFPGDGARFAPLDLPWLTRASVARARVRGLVVVETELWPNLLAAVRGRGGPVLLASARLSDRSFPRYRRLRTLWKPLLTQVAGVAARSAVDAERFVALGAQPSAVRVLGDLKWARSAPPPACAELLRSVGPPPYLLAASTHPGEEQAVLSGFRALREAAPELRLVMAPRHLDRVEAIDACAREHGFEVARRSRGGAVTESVVVLDTMGELASLYAHAALVFSGGSLAPVGGHNLVEIVQAGRVVVLGPHTHNQRPQVELLEPTGALVRVGDASELAAALLRLWRDPDRDAPARRARELYLEQRRALDELLRWMEQLGMVPRDDG